MITPGIQAAVPQFLAYFLQPLRLQSGGGPLSPAELTKYVTQLGAELEVTVGEYRPHAGQVPTCAGVTFPATHSLHVSRAPVVVQPGGADGITVSHTESANKPYPYKYFLRWLVERANPLVDGQETLRRVLQDLRPPSTWTPGAGPGTGTTTPGPAAPGGGTPPVPGADGTTPPPDAGPASYGSRVADAIAAMKRGFPIRVADVTSVPPGVEMTLDEFKLVLGRFFTYDEAGEYYAKWWVPGEGAFPEETTEGYREKNIETPKIEGDNVFVIGNVPSNFGLPGAENRAAGEFREFITRIDASSGDASKLTFDVISSAAKAIEVGGTPARDLFDFCFFTIKEEQP